LQILVVVVNMYVCKTYICVCAYLRVSRSIPPPIRNLAANWDGWFTDYTLLNVGGPNGLRRGIWRRENPFPLGVAT
jgi:hypothetical protein